MVKKLAGLSCGSASKVPADLLALCARTFRCGMGFRPAFLEVKSRLRAPWSATLCFSVAAAMRRSRFPAIRKSGGSLLANVNGLFVVQEEGLQIVW
jgi:hypothetical protein